MTRPPADDPYRAPAARVAATPHLRYRMNLIDWLVRALPAVVAAGIVVQLMR